MKKLLLLSFIAGGAVAAFLIYGTRTPKEKAADNILDAAEDAYDTMDKTIKNLERKTEKVTGLR